MVFQVSSNCRMFMLADALAQVSGCVPDIICVAQITLKFVDHALIVDNRRLLLFRGEDLTDLFFFFFDWKPGFICTPIFVLRFCISLFTELANCWSLNGSGATILEVPSLAHHFLTVMVLTFVLSQCFIVKLLTKPILLRKMAWPGLFTHVIIN